MIKFCLIVLTIAFFSLSACIEHQHNKWNAQQILDHQNLGINQSKTTLVKNLNQIKQGNLRGFNEKHNWSSRTSYYSSTSDSSKAKHPILDLIFGSLLFFSGFPLLIFNERRFVKTRQRLKFVKKEGSSMNPLEINPNLQGKLVHAVETTQVLEPLRDPYLQVIVQNSVALIRECEIYMWQETRRSEKRNGERRVWYEHRLEWSSSYVDSSSFVEQQGHQNINKWLVDNLRTDSQNVHFGAFMLHPSQIKQLNNKVELVITQDIIPIIQNYCPQLLTQHQYYFVENNYIYFANQAQGLPHSASDFRIKFNYIPCQTTTIVCQQQGNSFIEWEIPGAKQDDGIDANSDFNKDTEGCCVAICQICYKLNLPIQSVNWVEEKKLTFKEILKDKKQENAFKTKLVRFLGWLCLAFGIYLMLSPIYSLLYWFPLIGSFLGDIGSFICAIIAIIISTVLVFIVIGISWLFYRPKVAIILLLISGAVLFLCFYDFENRPTMPEQSQSMMALF